MNQTMDQHRARWAWDQTKATQEKLDDKAFGDYKSRVEGAAATILQTGLGQTIAFYLAQKKDDYDALLINLASWLCKGGGYEKPDQVGDKRGDIGRALLDEITGNDRDRYHALTDEALEYLTWLKRFAVVLVKGDTTANDGGADG